MTEKCARQFGVKVSLSTIRNYLSNSKYTLKEFNWFHCVEKFLQKIELRKEYAIRFLECQEQLNDANFKFLGEVGFNVSLRSKRGWSASGKSAKKVISSIRSRNTTICCIMTRNEIVAYDSADGTVNQIYC